MWKTDIRKKKNKMRIYFPERDAYLCLYRKRMDENYCVFVVYRSQLTTELEFEHWDEESISGHDDKKQLVYLHPNGDQLYFHINTCRSYTMTRRVCPNFHCLLKDRYLYFFYPERYAFDEEDNRFELVSVLVDYPTMIFGFYTFFRLYSISRSKSYEWETHDNRVLRAEWESSESCGLK